MKALGAVLMAAALLERREMLRRAYMVNGPFRMCDGGGLRRRREKKKEKRGVWYRHL